MMGRRSKVEPVDTVPERQKAVPDWNSKKKEKWFLELEGEHVNDEKWSCIVTAAIPTEAEDERYIKTYVDYVNKDLRKDIKVITMADLIKFLKSHHSNISLKSHSKIRRESKISRNSFRNTPFGSLLDVGLSYMKVVNDTLILPPDIMAALLKHLILVFKLENYTKKTLKAQEKNKLRGEYIKTKFIRDLKAYEIGGVGSDFSSIYEQVVENDAPLDGPDLYIMLVGFYDPLYFSALLQINVPLLAVFKISHPLPVFDSETSFMRTFWNAYREKCESPETTNLFKDIAIMDYKVTKENEEVIFDELSWMQYSVAYIQRQYYAYLKQLDVQNVTQNIEPLDLSKCQVYNKLCDTLVTGEPITPLLVLYAMIEQVVAGIPNWETIVLEHKGIPTLSDIPSPCASDSLKLDDPILVTPCKECRGKKVENVCEELHELESGASIRIVDSVGSSTSCNEESCKEEEHFGEIQPEEFKMSTTFIEKVSNERKTEKEIREIRIWKTPGLCFQDDLVFLQSYHCDPRLFTSETIINRFLKNAPLLQIWRKYPVLPAGERAFSNFHFFNLWKLSGLTEEMIKLKIFFTLLMKMICKMESQDEQLENKPITEEKANESSKLQLDEKEIRSFSNFFKIYIIGNQFRLDGKKQEAVQSKNGRDGWLRSTAAKGEPPLTTHCRPLIVKSSDSVLLTLHSLLEFFEISSLTEQRFINNANESLETIKSFKYFEKLDSNLMIQRLITAKESFNSISTSYFAPTDTLAIVMENDCDFRGIFTTTESASLLTPVCFRDFYQYVYSEIGTWLTEEETKHSAFISKLKEMLKTKEQKKDAIFKEVLKRRYCRMKAEEKEEFLNGNLKIDVYSEIKHKLKKMDVKYKAHYPCSSVFVATNYSNLRVENKKEIRQFNSEDGTQVSVTIDSWLYTSPVLLQLAIKRPKFSLYYYQWLNEHELNQDFTFRTDSDIVFAFQKNFKPKTTSNYDMRVSWPSGLLVKPVSLDSSKIYVRQSYIKHYIKGWDIESEHCRCFLESGKVVVIKDNGDYDVLFGNGKKISYYNSPTTSKFEIHSTTGEVWQIQTTPVCSKNKKKLITNNKIFIGVDPQHREIFYKREDGVTCMLFSTATLVTNYPDGTKITTTTDFEISEVMVEWTDEEKKYFREMMLSQSFQKEIKTRTILRNTQASKKVFVNEPFVLVSCSYLIEHPKYAKVYFSPSNPYAEVTMQENLVIFMYPEGNYEVQQDNNYLTLYGSEVSFGTTCSECSDGTSVILNLDGDDTLCKCVDFFRKAFFVYRDGRTRYQEDYVEIEEAFPLKTEEPCTTGHSINPSLKQRCFVLQRDLSGIEFLHEDSLTLSNHQLPEGVFDMEDSTNMSHTFNTPLYKIGYENWVMNYENESNSLPRYLKKKDLRDMGVKQVQKNLFKYPFPKDHDCKDQHKYKGKTIVNEPKVIAGRTVWFLSKNPMSIITELKNYIDIYQQEAQKIMNTYITQKDADVPAEDSRHVEMKLRKIALTLSQSFQMYPHLCTKFPSTEKEIHYFGHFINYWESIKDQIRDPTSTLSICKQIPTRFPRQSNFPCISEQYEPIYDN